ncbi:hypothetical protein E6O75_ATG04721 [Venturia nashicola]|uniref:Uncharacterized protein n=1 Tax=Venturia nashicola TaxID=86259 RepID=A0A4Z1P9A2_9PEZI|nr:hypothetical protein E6O75_ATG04721 [Venturia nashicola]
MADPDKKPTTFLSLPRELRQNILMRNIEYTRFIQDYKFNRALLKLDNNIMAIILSHTSATNTYVSNPATEKRDEHTFDNFHTASHQLGDYGIIPVHTVSHAENIAAVHPTIREDMAWVLRCWFGVLLAALLRSIKLDSTPSPIPRKRQRRQSIYVLEPFGGRRRLDKFTEQGFKSSKACRIAKRKAINKFNAEWQLTSLKQLEEAIQKHSLGVENFVP